MADAVIIELDYKGSYSRFALTQDEFDQLYRKERPDIDAPTTGGDSYTCRPLVHIWYCLTEIGGNEWNSFFTDMLWGLPQGDIETDNRAEIDLDECLSLKETISAFVNETKEE